MIHSYPWYIKDWLLSEARLTMTLEERGLYRDLLDHFFDQGSLPVNESALLRMAACDAKEFRRAWPAVRPKFEERDGRLYNQKASEILATKMARKEKNAIAGRSGGLAKAASKILANATANASECQENATTESSNPSHGRARSPSPTPTPLNPLPPFSEFDPSAILQGIVDRHPKSEGAEMGRRLLAQVILESVDREAVTNQIDIRHREYCKGIDNVKYAKTLLNWARELGYMDPPPKQASSIEEIDYPQ